MTSSHAGFVRWLLVGLGLCVLLLLLCATADAFWPFTRGQVAPADSVSEQDWQARFEKWESRAVRLGESTEETEEVAEKPGASSPTPSIRTTIRSNAAGQTKTTPGSSPSFDPAELARQARARADSLQKVESAAAAEADSLAEPTDPFMETQPGAFQDSLASDDESIAVSQTPSADSRDNAQKAAEAAAARAASARGFAPDFRATFSSSNDRMNINSTLSTSFSDPSGVTLSSSINYGEDISLTQNTESQSRGITNTFRLPIESQGLAFSLSTSNRRQDRSGTRTTSNERTQDSSEDRTATLNGSVTRDLAEGLSLNTGYARSFTVNEQDIATLSGASSGQRQREATGNSYGFGINADRLSWMKLRARIGRARNSNIDRSPSFGVEESTSEGDTASVNLDMQTGKILPNLTASFRVSRSTESFTDVNRTSTGVGNTTQFKLETRTNYSRTFRLNGKVAPFSFLNVDFGVEIARDSTSYARRKNQFRDTKRKRWDVTGNLKYASKGNLSVSYESSSSDNDQDEPSNPRNPQTRVDEERRLTADVNHEFTQSLKAHGYGEIRLNQGFYAHLGPQGFGDRDELRTRLGLDLNGRINAKIRANVQLYVRTFDQAFIDPRRSSSSRDETEYVVRQDFSYAITPKISLSQFYGLSSKVLDEIFDATRNTLNRNHFLRTRMNYQMTSRLNLTCNFDYLLQDNGLYVRDPRSSSEERFFSPTLRTKKDEIGVGVRYTLIKNGKLVFTSNQESTRERRTQFSSGDASSTNVTERGNLALGLESKIKVGDLQLDTKAQRNQSFNVNLNNKVFYNVESSLSYTF